MESSPRKSTHKLYRWTIALLVLGCAFLAAGLVILTRDSPLGLVLVHLAVFSWIVAFAHRWRRVKSFFILLVASLAGFLLLAVLQKVLYGLAESASEVVVLVQVLGYLELVFFLIAIFVCPSGVLIGVVGSVVLALSRFRRANISDELP